MKIEHNTIYNMDCFKGMKHIPNNSIDLVLTDPPYKKTQNPYDKKPIDISLFWKETKRILKKRGCIISTAVQPFTTDLISSNRSMFKYDLVWVKNRGTDFLNANSKPINSHESVLVFNELGEHENILIFYSLLPSYNPQKTKGKPYKKIKAKSTLYKNYNPHTRVPTASEDGSRFPTTVLYFARVENNLHPNQKPLKLFEWLIKSYSNKGDLVLDPFLGVGTTALACLRLQRNFIAFELEKEYSDIAKERIKPFTAEQKRLEQFKELS